MNNWVCQKCNTQNAGNFCLNCGVSANTQSASDLPPTVFGFQPPIPPQNQPSQFQGQSDFETQNQPPGSAAPKKSNLLRILTISGIAGLLVVGVGGFFLYSKVIKPYLYDQETARKNEEKESKAKSNTANDLLPESITRNSQTVNRGQTIDKSQLLEAIKKELPPLNSDINNINDAAAALYTTADKREATLQVFKYNSTEQAKNACQRIAQEMVKNKNNFISEPFFLVVDDKAGSCSVSGETKNGQYVTVGSSYGFLDISSGYKDYAQELALYVHHKLNP